MIIIPNEFTFVATPRTASRAIVEALKLKFPNAITDYPRDHHTYPDDVPLDYNVYTVIREPVDHVLSWWSHVDGRHNSNRRPLQFAKEYHNVMYFNRDEQYTLNMYADIANVFMPYTPDMRYVKDMLHLNMIETVGKSPPRDVSAQEIDELTEYMRDAFSDDMRLWETMGREYE